MRKVIVSTLFMLASTMSFAQKATLVAQIYEYQRDMVYFDCAQSPLIRQEFHTNAGEEHAYTFEYTHLVCMYINGTLKTLLQPGDSLHAIVRYQGRAVQSVEFSGTPQAVHNNRLYWKVEQLKRNMRYKSQLLACAALDVKPKKRLDDSRILIEKTKEMIKMAGKDLSKEAADYIMSDVYAAAYESFMEYPVMYADVRKTPVEKQEIGDYWNIMKDCDFFETGTALYNPVYASMLMRYCSYINEKLAHEKGETYEVINDFEKKYQLYVDFFKEEQRDAVLYSLLCEYIRNGKEVERVDRLVKDYREKYNINKNYIRVLDAVLQ